MEYLVFPAAVVNILLCFGLPQSQGNNLFHPINLNVSINHASQQLLLEWDINEDTEAEMVFDIQIYRGEENNIVFSENYTATLSNSNRPLKRVWSSDVPLECMPHAVRIRSRVVSSKTWSNWTEWERKDGMDSLDDGRSYVFPDYKVVEKGSSVTFCCIAKKNDLLIGYVIYGREKLYMKRGERRITFTEKNVPVSRYSGFLLHCAFLNHSDSRATLLFVTSKPDKPKHFDCETEDMTMLTCTWGLGQIHNYFNLDPKRCPLHFNLSDVFTRQMYCSCNGECKLCEFRIAGDQMRYNLRLTSQNCVGKEQTDVAFDIRHRIRLATPDQLSVTYETATSIQLFWHIKPTKKPLWLNCQVNIRNSFYPDAEEEHNILVWSSDSYPFLPLDGLQPYTKYILKVRCGAHYSFWKWSKWSTDITVQTNESAPSGQLDIWRYISSGMEKRNITVFWKALPGFRANGNINTYEICWENLEEPKVPTYCNSTELNNYTISLGSQSYKVNVSARNSANASTPSVIIISATGKNDTWNDCEENTANNTADSIYISWETQNTFDHYVVDWCNYPMSQPCGFQWRRFGQNVSSALITSDAFIPGVRYTFRVYGVQGDRSYLLEKKVKFLKELVSARELDFNIVEVTSELLTISWESYPQNSQPGFIRGYNVYVKVELGNCTLEEFEQLPDNPVIYKYTIKDRNQKNYTMKHLEPSTTYLIVVEAYSSNAGNITNYKFKRVTTQSERNWDFPLLFSLIIVPLLLILCVCFWKSDSVRNCLIPEIPQPYVPPFVPSFGKSPVITEKNEITPDKLVVIKKSGVDERSNLGRTSGLKTYFNPNYCQNLQQQEVVSKKAGPSWTSYQPLEHFFTSKRTSSPLKTVQGNLNDISQNKPSYFGVQQTNSVRSVESLQQSNYKPQLTTESLSKSPISDENMHLIAACSQTL